MSLRFIVDSACDYSQKEIVEKNLINLPLTVIFHHAEYYDGVTISHDEFYDRLVEDFPTSSQVSPFQYVEAFDEIIKNNDEAICFCISTGLSGSYQSAKIAMNMNEAYKDRVTVIDTKAVCIAERIIVDQAIRYKEEEKNRQEIVECIQKDIQDVKIYAITDTLEYLKKGGRLNSKVACIGELLSIKPIVSLDEDGVLGLAGKARGKKAGYSKMKNLILKDEVDLSRPISFAYAGKDPSIARNYQEQYFPEYKDSIIAQIGCAVGTHSGPGAIAFAYFKK